MKKTLNFFILLFALQTSFSQSSTGAFILDGTSTMNTQYENGEGLFTLQLNPTLGHFFSDNIVLGGSTTIGFATNGGSVNVAAGLTGFFRLYFNNESKNMMFAHIDGGFLSDVNGLSSTFGNIGLGLAHFLNPNVVLENQLTLGVQNQTDAFALYNLQLATGLKFYINRESFFSASELPFKSGTMMIGGTTGLMRLDFRENFNSTRLSLNPNFGIFINSNLQLGANLGLNYIDSGFNLSITNISFTPYIRYYLPSKSPILAFFLNAGTGFNYTRANSDFFTGTDLTKGIFFAGGGLDIFITPTVALEIAPSMFFQFGTDNSSSVVSFSTPSSTLGVNVGFQYYLTKGE